MNATETMWTTDEIDQAHDEWIDGLLADEREARAEADGICDCGSGLPRDSDGLCLVCWFQSPQRDIERAAFRSAA